MIGSNGNHGHWDEDDDPEFHTPYGKLPGGNDAYEEALAKLEKAEGQRAEGEPNDSERWVGRGETCVRTFRVYNEKGRCIGWSFPCSNPATVLAPEPYTAFGFVCESCKQRLLEINAEELEKAKKKAAARINKVSAESRGKKQSTKKRTQARKRK